MDAALLKDAMMALMLVVFAGSIKSALGNGAPEPLVQREGVTYTAVAARKYARSTVAALLPKRTVFARSMVHMESASLQAAPQV